MIKNIFALLLTLLVVNADAQKRRKINFLKDSIDSYIAQGMTDWKIPGMAVVIVKDGKVVWMKGYGVRDIETAEQVDENTLFMIASNTKLFTGTALAQLEYNGKIQLNDKVKKYIPEFALYDQNATEMATITDMLSHRIGTKTFQGDFTFWDGNLSRRGVINRMRTLQPTGIFRQSYGYCNSCFVTAGEVIPVVSQKPWEVYVYDSLLMPLGMSNTHMLTNGMDQRSNVAKPYTTKNTTGTVLLDYDRIDNLGPAASMVSSVNDMGRWLSMQLDSGRFEGKKILPWEVVNRTREVQLSVNSRKSMMYPTNFKGYGLGIFAQDYNGRQLYQHTGGAFGFVSNVCFVPEEKLGICILTNQDNQNFFEALRYQLLDAYLDVPYTNRSKAMLKNHLVNQEKDLQGLAELKARVASAKAPMLISQYTGSYVNETYGKMIITQASASQLKVEFKGHNNLRATLDYIDNDEWMLTYNHKGYGVFATRFTMDKGRPVSILIKVTDFIELDPYVFVKE